MNIVSYKYSFVLPIYNPGKSLIKTLKYYEHLSYKNFEVILIDDSEQNTFEQMNLGKLKIENLRYLHRKKDGLDAAFNFGIRASSGDIIIMATDDNLPEINFLDKLNKIYNEGYDFVIGRSKVSNFNNFFALYQSSYENYNYSLKNYKPKWSEGFSVKKECIENVGMYANIGIDGGNDNMLSEKLEKKFRVKRDFNLVMHHRAPESLKEFYLQQIQRGSAGPQFDFMFHKKSKSYILIKYILKTSVLFLNLLTQINFIFVTAKYFRNIEIKNFINFFNLLLAINIKNLFHTFGEIKAIKKLL